MPAETVDATAYRDMMSGFPTGVAVVTCTDRDGRPLGTTCSSVCSVTLTPPTLLVCLQADSPTLRAVCDRRGFTVNLLQHRARSVAERFSSRAVDRFAGLDWESDPRLPGPHLPAHALAIADCRLSRAEPVGDHVMLLGVVAGVVSSDRQTPLLYGRRRYAAWPDP